MVCTTSLHEYEQNQLTTNSEINEIVQELREKSGANWQVVERFYRKQRWFRDDVLTKRYELLVEVGGFLPFQIISGVSTRRECLCYMYGLLSGLEKQS